MNAASGLYDTFFRNYDPTVGSFRQVDPLAARYDAWSPYNYAYADPVYYSDPSGAAGDALPQRYSVADQVRDRNMYGSCMACYGMDGVTWSAAGMDYFGLPGGGMAGYSNYLLTEAAKSGDPLALQQYGFMHGSRSIAWLNQMETLVPEKRTYPNSRRPDNVDEGPVDPIKTIYINIISATAIIPTSYGFSISVQPRVMIGFDIPTKSFYLTTEIHFGTGWGEAVALEFGGGVSRESIAEQTAGVSAPLIDNYDPEKGITDIFSHKGVSAAKGVSFAGSYLQGVSFSADIDWVGLFMEFVSVSTKVADHGFVATEFEDFVRGIGDKFIGGEVNYSYYGMGVGGDAPALVSVVMGPLLLYSLP